MKIGILTYHCVPNFGAQLQTISTVGFLKRKGHEPIVLHWFPNDLETIYANGRIPAEQIKAHESFTYNILPLSNLCRTEDELIKEVDLLNLDAILVGSDALFKYQPERSRRFFSRRKLKYIVKKCVLVESLQGNPFFGEFLSKLKKKIPAVVFSVSSQNCPYTRMLKREKKKMRIFLSNYKSITVRDEWTRKMVRHITGIKDMPITPDPVFSFNQNNDLKMPSIESLKQKYGLSDSYALLSFSPKFIQKDYLQTIVKEMANRNIEPIAFPMPEGCFDFGIEKKISLPLSPLEWYVLIQHATCYIGERMHPIVVAIHNATPFFSFDEYGVFTYNILGKKQYQKESSKTYLILKQAGLLEYLYSYNSSDDFPNAGTIVDKIFCFDKMKCQSFAKSYQTYYEESMSIVLKSFSE